MYSFPGFECRARLARARIIKGNLIVPILNRQFCGKGFQNLVNLIYGPARRGNFYIWTGLSAWALLAIIPSIESRQQHHRSQQQKERTNPLNPTVS